MFDWMKGIHVGSERVGRTGESGTCHGRVRAAPVGRLFQRMMLLLDGFHRVSLAEKIVVETFSMHARVYYRSNNLLGALAMIRNISSVCVQSGRGIGSESFVGGRVPSRDS